MAGKKGSKHSKLETLEYKGDLVEGKVCNQCKILKPLNHFYKAPKGIGKRRPKCISCMAPTGRNITRLVHIIKDGNPYLSKKCKVCKEVLPLKNFYKGKGAGETASNCKKCTSKKASEHRKIKAVERKKIRDIDNINIFSKGEYSNVWTMREGFPLSPLNNQKNNEVLYKVTTVEGFEVLLPPTFDISVITKQTRYKQHSVWKSPKDLEVQDRISLVNLRDIQPWEGNGNFEQGWLIGEVLGDGGLSGENNYAYLAFWGASQEALTKITVERIKSQLGARVDLAGTYAESHDRTSIKSSRLTELTKAFGLEDSKEITSQMELSSYQFYRGLLRGLFDSDGSVQGTQEKGISVRLHQSNLTFLKNVQRMLLRLGIVSTLYPNRRDSGYRLLPDGKGGTKEYFCKAQHELVVSNDNIVRFRDLIGFEELNKDRDLNNLISNFRRTPNRERFTAIVNNIKLDQNSVAYEVHFEGTFDLNGIKVRKR